MTGTQINYYFICKRKLWLFANKIDMEQNSDLVAMGKFISESTYKREDHEIQIDDIVLDYFNAKDKIIHEIKKSDKMEDVHIWQVKHYINVLEAKGIAGVTGELNYPKLKQIVKVELDPTDKEKLKKIESEIECIISAPSPSQVINKPLCKNCSYYDLCYI